MNENSNVVRLRHPDEIDDPLTNILRSGARQLLAQAIELEAEAFLAEMKGFKLADGRDRVVRRGHGPERTIQTGIGVVEVARVKIRDRGAAGDGERIRFTSAILPLWARRTKSPKSLIALSAAISSSNVRKRDRRRCMIKQPFLTGPDHWVCKSYLNPLTRSHVPRFGHGTHANAAFRSLN